MAGLWPFANRLSAARPAAAAAVALALMLLLPGQAAAAPGDTVADQVFAQGGSFTTATCNLGGISASSLCNPVGGVVDATGNLYVADRNNNRVLEYNSPLTTDTVADRVFGQGGSFTTATCNLGGISASSLCAPVGVAVDGAGNLYVADDNNSRVLEYNNPLTTDTVADRVFGQAGSFTSGTCNLGGISASSLCNPNFSWAMDAAGHLYISDWGNNRVLEYDTPLISSVADQVFGQGGSFTSGTCNLGGVSASSLCGTVGGVVDAAGNFYIADTANNRVLEYDTPLISSVANRVFGQGGSFTTNTCNLGGISASSLCDPQGMGLDAAGRIYVTDAHNNRVLEYDALLTSSVADRVFGQGGSFTGSACNNGGISASSLCDPTRVAVQASGNLYIADYGNNRVLEYDLPAGPTPTATPSPSPTPSPVSTPSPGGPVGGTVDILAGPHGSSRAPTWLAGIGVLLVLASCGWQLHVRRRRAQIDR